MAYSAVYPPVGKPLNTGMPYGQPMYTMGQPGLGHVSHGSGFSGMAAAGSAAAGFMGGMLVGEALHAGHHREHDLYHSHDNFGDRGGYSPSDSGGGDFAADS